MAVSLETLLKHAPYVADLAQKHADWLAGAGEAETARKALIAEALQTGRGAEDEAALRRGLREAKARFALIAAIGEVTGAWSTAQAVAALSDFADATIEAALEFLIREAAGAGQIAVSDDQSAAAQSGLMILSLGKLGGRELNYSSDIDLVAFFDAERARLSDPVEAPRFYEKVTRRLAGILQERDEHGYVFRTDLRLRPDPGSTPVAISTEAALTYYEARGQNWERAAWIKARPSAGDIDGGEMFIAEMAPFIWRKHLDFATIADIQAMKRQINAARKVGGERALGHNVKLGRGGIREIEFFAQTQQLIAGGRQMELRSRSTVKTLEGLARHRFVEAGAAGKLVDAYWFLRAVENRLQMRRDEQTHQIPETAEELGPVAALMGFAEADEFAARYRATVEMVIDNYADLFADKETLASAAGDLVFTGGEDDPGTLETLLRLGFKNPEAASATIRKWHYGGYAATRAPVARQHLTELMPVLLETFAGTGAADEALSRFDTFLGRLPAGVQLFALLRNAEALPRLFIDLLGSAPRLTEQVLHRVHIVDALIDPEFYGAIPGRAELERKIDQFLGDSRSYEDLLGRARIMGQEQVFLTSVGLIAGMIAPERAGQQFTTIAEILMARVFVAVQRELAAGHGVIPGARAGVLAFGKFASREMTATSDLDFIMLYDAPAGADISDGKRKLEPSHYYARLTQRLVAAISAPTAEGVLYPSDMRLRPSGRAGPMASTLAGFEAYQVEHAWTWEHLALTRARVICADEGMAAEVTAAIERVLGARHDVAKTLADVADMRGRLSRDRKAANEFDLKLVEGGLIDLEFIAQTAQLIHRAVIASPQATTVQVLERLAETGILADAARLAEIHRFYTTVLQMMSACLLKPLDLSTWTDGFREILLRATYTPSMTRLESDLREMRGEVAAAFEKFIGAPKA